MCKLYKGRYLISLYEHDNETLVEVFANCIELSQWLERDCSLVRSNLSHLRNEEKRQMLAKYRVHLIDCYQVNNDVFKDEDIKFIEFLNKEEHIKKINKKINYEK